jgi:hypothetical protein
VKGWTLQIVKETEISRSARQYRKEGYSSSGANVAALLDEVEDHLDRIGKAAGSTQDVDYLASMVSKLRAIR